MAIPAVLTFEYQEEQEDLVLSGDAVAEWDEEERRIAHVTGSELDEYKHAFRNDVRNLEKHLDERFGGELCYESDPRSVGKMLKELLLAGHRFWRNVSGDRFWRKAGTSSWLKDLGELLTRDLQAKIGVGLAEKFRRVPTPQEIEQVFLLTGDLGSSRWMSQIETKGPPGALLPLDALPLGWPENLEKLIAQYIVQDEEDVLLLASGFAGFNWVVRHTPLRSGTYVHPASVGERATLYLRSVNVEAYDEMQDVLGRQKTTFLGPFPSEAYYHDAADVARALLIGEPALGPYPAIPDLVQVHAHAAETESLAEGLLITFDYDKRDKDQYLVVRSSHIEEVAALRRYVGNVTDGPLVVFNACQALGSIGMERLSTALDLAEFGSRAVIGPREDVRARFAVRFSEALHGELLSHQGSTIGEAAVAARRVMLRKYLNPLGLLYATFGDVESTRSRPL